MHRVSADAIGSQMFSSSMYLLVLLACHRHTNINAATSHLLIS